MAGGRSPGRAEVPPRKSPCRGSRARTLSVRAPKPGRRVARADASMRPPRHGHIAAVDWMEAALGKLPIETICAVRLDRQRFGGDTFAAPLPTARLRPVSGFFGAYRCLRRMPSADPFVFPDLAPESAGGAIGGSGRLVSHYPSLGPAGLLRRYGAKPGGLAPGSGGAAQPPPSASIRPILATNWRVRNAIARRSGSSAALCAVTTSHVASARSTPPVRRISRLAMRARRTNRVAATRPGRPTFQ